MAKEKSTTATKGTIDITLDTINKRADDLNALGTRMDADMNLYRLKAYQMLDFKNKPVKNIINVTWNDPMIFADRCISILGAASPQVVVRSAKMAGNDKNNIVNFLYGAVNEANSFSARKQKGSLHQQLAFFGVLRGWVTAYCAVLEGKNNQMRFDVHACDPRYMTWLTGEDGLLWAAYKTKRTKDQIIAQFGKDYKGKGDIVTDAWTMEKHKIFVGKVEKVTEDNQFEEVPFVIMPVIHTPELSEENAIKYVGESVYKANRLLYPELNRVMSILQTINAISFRGAMEYASEEGEIVPEGGYPGPGKLYPVKGQEGWRLVPIHDIRQSAPYFIQLLTSAIQRGSYAYVEYGGLDFPLSSVALAKLGEGRDQILLPIVNTMSIIYQQLFKMMIKQFIAGGISTELTADDKAMEFKPSDLTDMGYTLKFRFKTASKADMISALSVAGAATQFYDMETVLTDILEADNPIEVANKKLAELADQFPEIGQYHMALALLALGKDKEAKILSEGYLRTAIEQLKREGPQINNQKGGGGGYTPPKQGGAPIAPATEGGSGMPLMDQHSPEAARASMRAATSIPTETVGTLRQRGKERSRASIA
jgi:hypothetical protein